MPKVFSRSEAKALGKTKYYTGIPCVRGHVVQKWVANGQCVKCASEACKRHNNKPGMKELQQTYYQNRKKRILAESPWKLYLRNAEKGAKLRGLEYDLDEEWFKEKWTGRCALTNIPFSPDNNNNLSIFGCSLDRIDNSKGYLKDNCRFILCGINFLKMGGTDADVLKVAKALVENLSG